MSGLRAALAAELVRGRRTSGAWLWLVGAAISLWGYGNWRLIGGEKSWQALMGWHVIYATGLCLPVAALASAMTMRRERAARSGGTDWRPVGQAQVRAARLIVLLGQHLGLILGLVLPPLVLGALLHDLGPVPVRQVAATAALLWLAAAVWIVLGHLLAERIGLFPSVAVAFVWQIVATIHAERGSWWMEPWTWSVRPILPVLGVHGNGVPATPGEAVLAISPWPAVGLSLALLALLSVLAVLVPAPRPRPRRRRVDSQQGAQQGTQQGTQQAAVQGSVQGPVPRRRPAPLRAMVPVVWTRASWAAVVSAVLFVVATRLVWNANYTRGLVGLLVVPCLGCLLACLAVQGLQPSLRSILTRTSATRHALVAVVLTAVPFAAVVLLGAALSGQGAAAVASVGLTFGLASLVLSMALAVRFSSGAAAMVTLVGLVLSVVMGGSVLAEAPLLWLLGPWSWAYSANTPGRMVVAVLLSVALTALSAAGLVRALKGSAARS